MGMDLYGKKPLSNTGEYFRNNVWWWRPLAVFVQKTYPTLTSKCKAWHTNDGDGLGKVASLKLAMAIRADVVFGKVKEYENKFNEAKQSKPKVKCEICNGTGIRNDDKGVLFGYATKELDKELADKLGRNIGWCNGCDGHGESQDSSTWYAFSEENVIGFADFLENSGGFKIC